MTNKEELLQIITKLENLKQEKSEVAQTTSDSLAEAKTKGHKIKILEHILKLRKIDDEDRIRQNEELEIYKATISMQ
jgi:uncharacterized protein (UPF0335 family)